MKQNEELINIITKFAESGWDLIDAPSATWLTSNQKGTVSEADTKVLISAVEQADLECGSCGCEFDPLYKRALVLLRN
jgi:hypothetical protein